MENSLFFSFNYFCVSPGPSSRNQLNFPTAAHTIQMFDFNISFTFDYMQTHTLTIIVYMHGWLNIILSH